MPVELRRPWALGTPAMSKMDQDATWALNGTARALADAFGLPPSRCTYFVRSQARGPSPSFPHLTTVTLGTDLSLISNDS